MTKEMKRPISNITQDSIKPLLSNAVEFYTNKNREAHKCIQERDEYINYLESKLSNAKPQQSLPVVPEFVADYISELKEKGHGIQFGLMCSTHNAAGEGNEKAIHWKDDNAEDFARAWLDGYQVEKPQLFYIALPKVYGLSDSTFVSKAESGIISEFTKGKDYALKLTEQEIKSIDERYWQFAVPVEDGE
ncbi:DUF1642 domain-containing protein [Lactococcus lactis]|uniref:DUF1642 domain-containing protein n=2 Tax=Lactococcus lactis TaxID=1358 RepID=UPI0032AF2F29